MSMNAMKTMNINHMSLTSNGRSGILMSVIILHVLGLCGLLFSAHAVHKTPPAPEPMWMIAVSAPAPAPLPTPKQEQKPESKPQTKPVLLKQLVVRQSEQAPVRVALPVINNEAALPMPADVAATVLTATALAPVAPPAATPPAPPAPLIPPQFNAAYLNNPLPAYPPVLRRAGEQGRVILRVLVNIDGSAAEVRIHHSSGSPLFDDAAQVAVRKWRFVPARRGETMVSEWVQVPIDFKLS